MGALGAAMLVSAALGCSGAEGGRLGDHCLPPDAPSGGFDSSEVSLHDSPDCNPNRPCMVYELEGDPTPGCEPGTCADPSESRRRVFCTCQCDGESASADELCECPAGFRCEGVEGTGASYCVGQDL
jgi:hypothetical protein